ncbi:hypothetical protein ACHAWF_004397, partial [Thalassiosira exigua]
VEGRRSKPRDHYIRRRRAATETPADGYRRAADLGRGECTMAPLSASNILIGSTSLTNLSSSRHRPPSLASKREEGWTEVWGGKDRTGDDAGGGDSPSEFPYLPPRYVTVIEGGDGEIETSGKLCEGPSALKLTQHRVAWFEQFVLRANFIPHVVENSGYACTESTGSFPCLLDLTSKKYEGDSDRRPSNGDGEWGCRWEKTLSQLDKPVLLGRNQPGGLGGSFFHQFSSTNKPSSANELNLSSFLSSGSHIVDYLRLKHFHRMRNNLLFPEHMKGNPNCRDALAYETLIRDKLGYILLALRYGNDPAWEGVYRPQCIRARLDPNGEYALANGGASSKPFFPLWAWYQTYSERTLALHNLLPSSHAMHPSTHSGLSLELFRYNDYRHIGDEQEKSDVHQHHPFSSFVSSRGGTGGGDTSRVNVYRAVELAGMYYASLEERLDACFQRDGAAYFLGTEEPTYIDALLFSHLAEALCDIHLVLILGKYSRLMQYFRWIYDKHFGKDYATALRTHGSGARTVEHADWIRKNDIANGLNAFNQIPEATSTKQVTKKVLSEDDTGHEMVHAIQLMQQMAVHCNEFDEALRDAATLRLAEGADRAVLESYHRPIGSRLYHWLMGSDINFWGSGCSKPSEDKEHDSEGGNDGDDSNSDQGNESSREEDDKKRKYQDQLEKIKRDRRKNDELWLSGVVVAVAAALLMSASRKS